MDNQQQVTKIVSELTRVPLYELKADTRIFESRLLTSLGLLDLVAQLEKQFGIAILPEELIHDHFDSIGTIVSFIGTKQTAS